MASEIFHEYKTGDILVSCWGYDQTNVDFYQVVKVTPKSVRIRPIAAQRERIGSETDMSDYCIPVPGKFLVNDRNWAEGKTVRVDKYGEVNGQYSTACKWDGRPVYRSWYA